MNREKFLALLSKKMRNELSPGEEQVFEKCIREHNEYRQLNNAIGTAVPPVAASRPDIEARLSAIWKRIEGDDVLRTVPATRRSFRWKSWLKIAAVLLLVGGMIVFARYFNQSSKGEQMLVLHTTNEKLYATLPDGTQITLNTHSILEYNTGFGNEKRKIVLQGEAFFDVTENKNIPLQVLAGPLLVEVKGTAFNVNAYRNSPEVSVVLLRGAVEVSRRGDRSDKVLLKPNQWLLAPNTTAGAIQFRIDSVGPQWVQQLHWMEDSLVFRKEQLQHIVLRLEKKYRVSIEIKTEALKEKRFSGMFVHESLAEGLDALKMAYPFQYKIEDKKVTIR
ncbi:DUF4974 domain-containing protein [Niabella sp. CC-SYL272]|uniref:FecR domain-containing protein n=1 Tax=Niabella agricola TaxID=2891571 RepID=UPI001F35D2FF|nr:FecR domain-containing protein [Niabella agricola]MCF3109645.1 DUF4974 domain-containing protein [Niabella agricola]